MNPEPYYSLNTYYRERFGRKVYKLAIDAGFTCPNRDGTVGTGGCTFCLAGSGTFAARGTADAQIDEAKALLAGKVKDPAYIAYLQAFSNTYAPVDELEALYSSILEREDILGLAIGTRPDCLGPEVVELLSRLNRRKPIWVELGLQTIHASTAAAINRCFTLDDFQDAVLRLADAGVACVVHLIFGLPGETEDMMLETVDYVADLPIEGVKLQVLHVLAGTALAKAYQEQPFPCLEEYEWYGLLAKILPRLPESLVIHRLTGDGPKASLIAPLWTANKRQVRNHLQKFLKENEVRQGSMKKEPPSNVKTL